MLKLFITVVAFAICLVDAVVFQCNPYYYNYDGSYGDVAGNLYTCEPYLISTGSSYELENVEESHKSGKGSFDVEALWINKLNLPIFVKNINQFLPNLVLIHYASSQLTKISAEDLKPFPRLKWLSLHGNKLTNIDNNLFQYTTRVEWIDLSKNQIRNVGSAFNALNSLKYLYFSDNFCFNGIAENRIDVLNLVKKIESSCPSLATSKSITTFNTINSPIQAASTDFCKLSCVEDLRGEIVEKMNKLSEENLAQTLKIQEQKKAVEILRKEIADLRQEIFSRARK